MPIKRHELDECIPDVWGTMSFAIADEQAATVGWMDAVIADRRGMMYSAEW